MNKLPIDYRNETIDGLDVTVRVYATSQKGRVKPKMTRSYRSVKRPPMSMSEKRRGGFCK